MYNWRPIDRRPSSFPPPTFTTAVFTEICMTIHYNISTFSCIPILHNSIWQCIYKRLRTFIFNFHHNQSSLVLTNTRQTNEFFIEEEYAHLEFFSGQPKLGLLLVTIPDLDQQWWGPNILHSKETLWQLNTTRGETWRADGMKQ